MKIKLLKKGFTLFLFATFSVISAHVSAQKITFSRQNIKLETVLDEVKKQSGYNFAYSPQVIDVSQTVSIVINDLDLKDALATLFKGTDIRFEIKDKKILLFPKSGSQKNKTLTGIVKDSRGEPLIGASVVVEGFSTGTVTDIDGNFTISVADEAASNNSLVISYVSYITQRIPIKNKTVFNIVMVEDSKTIEEVVVVAYGTQKKSSITGSIDVVSGKKIENMPVANIAQSLQGIVPGLIVSDKGGKPGSSPSVNIRALGTIAKSEPLVVIDGIPTNGMGDFYALNSGDIESISVLKDASSAAIYGSRASNGVLLVTTRRGDKEHQPKVDISYSNSRQIPTKVPELNNSWDYAMLVNESYTQAGGNIQFSDAEIQMMKDGSNPDFYSNTNWWKEGVKSSDNMNQANIRVSGGTVKSSYMISAGYTSQQGLIDYTDFSKYNARMNLSTQIIDNLEVSAGVSYYKDNRTQPDHYDNFFGSVLNMPPYLPVKRSNGDWGHLNNEDSNPIAWITDGGNSKNYNNNLLMNATANWEITKGLRLKGQISNNLWELGNSTIYRTIDFVNEDGTHKYSNNPNSVSRSMTEDNYLTLQAILEYEKRFHNDHYFKAMAGYTDERDNRHWVGGNRKYIPDNSMGEIDAATGTGDNQSSWGNSTETRLYSYFGRLNYDYASRYFLELNLRYDGSSRLAPRHEYTTFPSGSIGWRISEENFMKSTRNILDNLKLRGSYGQLGNQTIDPYQYAAVMANNPKEYMFGHQWTPGAYLNLLPNYNLTWEISTILDIGADFGFLGNRLSGSFDWYRKKTSDILLPVQAPGTLGTGVSVQNAGVVASWGEELQLTWRDKINQFNYGITLSFADQMNEVLDLKGATYRYTRSIIEEGHALNTLYGYKCLGYFSSDEEIVNSPKPSGYASQIKIGDLKYEDISGPNGVPDGVIDSYDRTYLGWNAPRFMYGLDLTGDWNGFDFRVFFQGVGKRDEVVMGGIVFNPTSKSVLDDRWSPYKTVEENMAQAKLPRLVNGQQNNYEMSSFYVKNAAYIRLKNLQIGYTLPKELTQKISFERVRFYFSANNLFTITSLPYVDPENSSIDVNSSTGTSTNPTYSSSGAYYPQLKSFSLGVDITIGKN